MSGRMKTAAAVLVTASLAAGMAFAQGGGFPGMMGGGGPRGGMAGFGPENLGAFRMIAERLDLTDDQKESIETIIEETREEIDAIFEEAGPPEERPRFMELFTATELTVADLEAAIPGSDEIRDAIRTVTLNAVVEIHDVLTVEQLSELALIIEEHADMAPGMGCGMMGRGGMMDHGMPPCADTGDLPR
jgi:Spy/CpxP family protein refolding chaperone